MSTDYTLYMKDGIETFYALEHSARIDLVMPSQISADEAYDGTVEDLSATEVVGIALELLKVASYVNGDLRGMLEPYLQGRSDADYYRVILKELVA